MYVEIYRDHVFILIIHLEFIVSRFIDGIGMQGQSISGYSLLVIKPITGERTVIICSNGHFQIYRLTGCHTHAYVMGIFISPFRIGIQMVFYMNVEINIGIVLILVTNLKTILSIFRNRLSNQSVRIFSFDFFPVQIP